MRVPFRLVDVFTEAPFAGTSSASCPRPRRARRRDDAGARARDRLLRDDVRDAVRADGYDVRIFTPEDELPFAGHPTLGPRSRSLARADRVGGHAELRGGRRPGRDRRRRRVARRCGSYPRCSVAEVEDRAAVAAAAGLEPRGLVGGLPIVPVSTGIPHLMVPVRDEDALRRAVGRRKRLRGVCARRRRRVALPVRDPR